MLAEIKSLMDKFVTAHGEYETLVPNSKIDWEDHKEADGDLSDMLCLLSETPTIETAEIEKKIRFRGLRSFGKGVKQTGKNIRTIVVELKRLKWATLDEEKFSKLSFKIGELNTFLTTSAAH